MKRRGRYRRLTRTHCGRTKTSREEFSTRQRTSQEEGLAPARPNPRNGGGKPLFLTCSILFSHNSMKFLFLCLLRLKTSGTTHRAMVTRFATGLHAALLFTLEEIDEFRHCRFFNPEPLHTRMPR